MTKQESGNKNPPKEQVSNHFDGERFFYPGNPKRRDFWTFLKWMSTRRHSAIPWPKKRSIPFFNKPKAQIKDGCVITFVNHSTMLIQWKGWNILTDPIWSDRCGPFGAFGPKRVHEPGIAFEDLPWIDIVLISHNHYDHLDIPTLKRLHQAFSPQIFTGLGNRKFLHKHHLPKVIEFDWWDQQVIVDSEITLTFVPARHFSARGVFDRNKTLWGGFVLTSPTGSVYFAGDTGYGSHFQEIRERFGPPSLSFLPIGAYEPRWFMEPVHLSPEEALQAHADLGSLASTAIHFGTFCLSDEGIDDPTRSLWVAMEKRQVSGESFWVLQPGQAKYVPHLKEF